ncbi:MAG: D-alanyl-D-alanine carboxypeptidase/D-alanyl-D-alanine endopeptidase [Acidimicrobiales bacterium]
MQRTRVLGFVVMVALSAAACSSTEPKSRSSPTTTAGGTSVADSGLPDPIKAIMSKPRYAAATWNFLAVDVKTGDTLYAFDADQMAFTGSTRKLFSVGTALNGLGTDHREITPVHRRGTVDQNGALNGDLVLVAKGDLTFGGRRINADTIQVTNLDHGDANTLAAAELTPQDPLFALNQLATGVKASGITSVRGNVAIDTRFFTPYRVPNNNVLITPILVNENLVDVTITPTQPGQPATVDYRPKTAAFTVESTVTTGGPGSDETVEISDKGLTTCLGQAGCKATISGSIPQGYKNSVTGAPSMIHTFRVDEPEAFARTAFIEALQRQGVTVSAPAVAPNPASLLPAGTDYGRDNQVASFTSPPLSQDAKLILKVSLDQGANLILSLFGQSKGQVLVQGALASERKTLIDEYGLRGDQFDFPTNGSGSPDSRATPRALVQMLTKMRSTRAAADFQAALPVLGVDGSMYNTSTDLPAKGHVFTKPGTTVSPSADGKTVELKAQNLAGYVETKGGRTVAFAVMVNNAGTLNPDALTQGIFEVFSDEGAITNYLYVTH